MNKESAVQWQYKTIFFELQKDGLLGDKYIDDENVETVLNEEGAGGWELVTVTMVPDGMIAFCKRSAIHPVESDQQTTGMNQHFPATNVRIPESKPVAVPTLGEQKHLQGTEKQQSQGVSGHEQDTIGEIKIS